MLQQRNLKQKFAALLRRFRMPEEMSERGTTRDTHHAQRDIDELFQVSYRLQRSVVRSRKGKEDAVISTGHKAKLSRR